jgi:hypothetical protein
MLRRSGLIGSIRNFLGKLMFACRRALLVAAAVVSACVGATSLGVTAANALTCPVANTGLWDRLFELSGASSCAFGDGNINNGQNVNINTLGYVGAYPNPPFPLTGAGVYPVPGGAGNALDFYPPGGASTGTFVTETGLGIGTLTFSSLFNFTDVFVGIKGGNTPDWAVFYLGAVAGGTVLTWDWLKKCTGNPDNCTNYNGNTGYRLEEGAASGITTWGTATEICTGPDCGGGGNPPPVPLPGAVWLFGTALAGLGFLGMRRRRAKSSF